MTEQDTLKAQELAKELKLFCMNCFKNIDIYKYMAFGGYCSYNCIQNKRRELK